MFQNNPQFQIPKVNAEPEEVKYDTEITDVHIGGKSFVIGPDLELKSPALYKGLVFINTRNGRSVTEGYSFEQYRKGEIVTLFFSPGHVKTGDVLLVTQVEEAFYASYLAEQDKEKTNG